ncbi:hypothetical protein GWK47_022366 [Chionoecetes opilio]|uniref:Uncharacterized protein n=1 Tax=Chionoecetes opilio TaxID=41210 RepID=A0A8J5CDS9_CHIOP|nr:hypothetical protein GWK47_022366 [Chionoecetes opilio]
MATRAASNFWLIDKAPIDEITEPGYHRRSRSSSASPQPPPGDGEDGEREQEGSGGEVSPSGPCRDSDNYSNTRRHEAVKRGKGVHALKRTRTKTGRNIVWMRRFLKETSKKSSTSHTSSSLQRADVMDRQGVFPRSQREDRGESSMAGIDLVKRRRWRAGRARTRLKRLREREDSDIARLSERAEIPKPKQ